MTPEQIQEIARLVAAQVSAPPWWTYLLMLVCAAAGTFIGAYLKRRGENYATTADFEKLKEQLRANTHAVESVKTGLADGSWMRQQLWAHRERYYMDLLRLISRAKRHAGLLLDITEPSGYPSDLMDADRQRRYEPAFAELVAVEQEISEMLVPSAVFLSRTTHQTIAELLGAREAIGNNAIAPFDFYDEWRKALAAAYDQVLTEAQRELHDAFKDDAPSTP